MSRTCRALLVGVFVALAVCGALLAWLAHRGLSAREEPSALEAWAARSSRQLATPEPVRDARNPVLVSAQVLAQGRAHFADHCATCHASRSRSSRRCAG